MEKEYSFDPIPLQLMWGAQCHFCNNTHIDVKHTFIKSFNYKWGCIRVYIFRPW